MEVREIDFASPLEEQGPFHVIVHKTQSDAGILTVWVTLWSLSLLEWESELMEYSAAHPDTIIVDPIDRICILRDRSTMLSLLPSGDAVPVNLREYELRRQRCVIRRVQWIRVVFWR